MFWYFTCYLSLFLFFFCENNFLCFFSAWSEMHKEGHRTTGRSAETKDFLTERACALSNYAIIF